MSLYTHGDWDPSRMSNSHEQSEPSMSDGRELEGSTEHHRIDVND